MRLAPQANQVAWGAPCRIATPRRAGTDRRGTTTGPSLADTQFHDDEIVADRDRTRRTPSSSGKVDAGANAVISVRLHGQSAEFRLSTNWALCSTVGMPAERHLLEAGLLRSRVIEGSRRFAALSRRDLAGVVIGVCAVIRMRGVRFRRCDGRRFI
jgi:hypothetical protein